VGEGGRGGEGVKGKINYTVWSDVFVCPQCGKEMVFWDVAVDQEKGEVRDDWDCPHCRARLSKSPRKDSAAQRVERAFETHFDRALGQNVRQAKQVPVLINYSVETASSRRMTGSHSHTKRYEKHPDAHDLALIAKIEDSDIPYPFPTDELPDGFNTQQPRESHGLTHVHHFYTHRNLRVLATTYAKVEKSNLDIPIKAKLRFLVSSYNLTHSTRMTRIIFKSNGNKPLLTGHQTGTLYASSLPVEKNIFWGIGGKVITVKDATLSHHQTNVILQTASASSAIGTKNSIDYIFVDPPFGANLMYSELNFLWEAWLSMFTNNTPEAIVNKIQRKGLPEYQELMEGCFREFYRLLKSGHWMTVEFHNSQNAVWNAIQEGLLRAGFMIADVRTLDKQQGSFKQVTTTAAVKQDLIISAYKPARGFEQRFLQAGGSPEAAWDFIRQHLEQLPVPQVGEDGLIETLAERQPYLLYDRMVAFHIQRGLAVPLSAPEFYQGLPQRFLERDGMIFTPAHAAEYDQRRMKAERVEQLALFVSDEKSALQWLRRELTPTSGAGPQTYGDLQPKFMQEARSIARHEQMPELRDLLEANFLHDDAGRWYLPDPGKQADLDALRQKSLLREFNTYLEGRGRLKAFRSEAVRAGFGHAWKERQYAAIVQVAERLPANVLEEDPELLMYADNARLRAGDEPKQKGLWDG
jgi:rubredoxin